MALDLGKLNEILKTVSTNKWLLICLTAITLTYFATKLFGPGKSDPEAVKVLQKQNDQCSTEKQQFVDYILKMNNSLKEMAGQPTSFNNINSVEVTLLDDDFMFAVYDTTKKPMTRNQQQQQLLKWISSNDSVLRRAHVDSLRRADSIKKRG